MTSRAGQLDGKVAAVPRAASCLGAVVDVQVWSDIACPWCYLGKRRFERAVETFAGEVSVVYRSFELAPDTPVDFAGSAADFLSERKGLPRQEVERMLAEMTELAAAEGLRYDFSALRHTRTLLAHEAIHHAKAQGKQEALVERLFRAYFEEGRHLGHAEELAGLAAEVGLDTGQMRRVLDDGLYAEAVLLDIDAGRRLGLPGVPFYLIDGRYGVSGAQTAAVFVSALERAAGEHAALPGRERLAAE